MEYPAPGLYLHLDLGVRGADGHMAYRTMPASSPPDPASRNGLRRRALNPCRNGLIESAHRLPPTGVMAGARNPLRVMLLWGLPPGESLPLQPGEPR